MTSSDQTRGATVRRVVAVGDGETVRFTLSIPLAAFRQGVLRVYDRRGELSSHVRVVGGAASFGVDTSPAMLVVSSRPEDCTDYITAVGGGPRKSNGFSIQNTSDASVITEVVPPESLPESWIDFSGLDFVAISRDDLAGLKPPVRSALLKWVHSGGNLIVHHAGASPGDLETLERLLGLNSKKAGGPGWAKTGGRDSSALFASHELMLGLVCAFPGQWPDSSDSWSLFLGSVAPPRSSWLQRYGVAPDVGTEEFYNFMNPNIHGVPVYGFMVLITAFAALIGPVNYFYLRRKRLLWMLLVTVPATALVTSVLLVSYSVAAHGFSIRSRIRSLTVLDQESRSAVTFARLSLFAGLAPARGMQFSRDTAVYPVFPPTTAPGIFAVDWTENQALTSGWLMSRTRTQFLTVSHAEQKARVDIKPGPDGGLAIVNGLPWELEAVLVADASGRLLSAQNVQPKATGPLSDLSVKDRSAFVRLLGRNHPELPDDFTPPTFTPLLNRRQRFFAGMAGLPNPHFDSNLMERQIRTWSQDLSAQKTCLPPRSFLAVLRQNPGVDTGVGPTIEQAGYHLLLGSY
ncbi:hypothetical protein [Singulisphaera sp. PoT]|uniref:hypothetical protein n=1 Tax=Singulisphaera sp. PoT TaxID=3411797 RepID=UPI003BF5F871